MDDNFNENVVPFFQKSLPLISSVIIMLLAYLPVNFALFNNIRPDFGMMCIYFWMLHRPDLFNLLSVLVLGVVDMLITSALPGATLGAYLMMYVLVFYTQKYFNAKPFIVIWYGFMALSLLTVLVKWLVVSVYYSAFLPMSVLIFAYLIGVAVYPLVSMFLAFLQNTFIQDEGL